MNTATPKGTSSRPALTPRRGALVLLGLLVGLGCGSSTSTGVASPTAASLSIACAAEPTSGPAPLGVAFSVTVAGPNPPYSVFVTFGDGQSGTGSGGHLYTQPGSYNAQFTASGSGQSATCSQSISVSPAASGKGETAPHAIFRITPDPPAGGSPLVVTFNGCRSFDPDGDRLQFTFQFGDGTSASGPCRTTHTYVGSHQTFGATACVSDGTHTACHRPYAVQVN